MTYPLWKPCGESQQKPWHSVGGHALARGYNTPYRRPRTTLGCDSANCTWHWFVQCPPSVVLAGSLFLMTGRNSTDNFSLPWRCREWDAKSCKLLIGICYIALSKQPGCCSTQFSFGGAAADALPFSVVPLPPCACRIHLTQQTYLSILYRAK